MTVTNNPYIPSPFQPVDPNRFPPPSYEATQNLEPFVKKFNKLASRLNLALEDQSRQQTEVASLKKKFRQLSKKKTDLEKLHQTVESSLELLLDQATRIQMLERKNQILTNILLRYFQGNLQKSQALTMLEYASKL